MLRNILNSRELVLQFVTFVLTMSVYILDLQGKENGHTLNHQNTHCALLPRYILQVALKLKSFKKYVSVFVS